MFDRDGATKASRRPCDIDPVGLQPVPGRFLRHRGTKTRGSLACDEGPPVGGHISSPLLRSGLIDHGTGNWRSVPTASAAVEGLLCLHHVVVLHESTSGRTSKCLSTSQLNSANSIASAFRLPGNRPARGPPTEAISESEVRDLVSKLPPDLAERVSRGLCEIDAEVERISRDFAMIGCRGDNVHQQHMQLEEEKKRRKSRVNSSSCEAIDASTSTSEPLAVISEATGPVFLAKLLQIIDWFLVRNIR